MDGQTDRERDRQTGPFCQALIDIRDTNHAGLMPAAIYEREREKKHHYIVLLEIPSLLITNKIWQSMDRAGWQETGQLAGRRESWVLG